MPDPDDHPERHPERNPERSPDQLPGVMCLVTATHVPELLTAYRRATEHAQQLRALLAAHRLRMRVIPGLGPSGQATVYLISTPSGHPQDQQQGRRRLPPLE